MHQSRTHGLRTDPLDIELEKSETAQINDRHTVICKFAHQQVDCKTAFDGCLPFASIMM